MLKLVVWRRRGRRVVVAVRRQNEDRWQTRPSGPDLERSYFNVDKRRVRINILPLSVYCQ